MVKVRYTHRDTDDMDDDVDGNWFGWCCAMCCASACLNNLLAKHILFVRPQPCAVVRCTVNRMPI